MNYPKDDIYMDRIPEHYSSHNGTPYRDVIYNNLNDKNKMSNMKDKNDTSQKVPLKGFKDGFQNYYANFKDKTDKSQHIGKFRRFISKIKIWFSGICVNRSSFYDDLSSNDGDYRDRMQNAPLLQHDHGSNTFKPGIQAFTSPDESPKRDDIWAMESRYIKDRHPRNGHGKTVPKSTRNRPPTMPSPSVLDSSFSVLPNDNYGFFSDKYTEI